MTERKCDATTNIFGHELPQPCDTLCWTSKERWHVAAAGELAGDGWHETEFDEIGCCHHVPLYAPTEERGEGDDALWKEEESRQVDGCTSCEWTGAFQTEDKCPACGEEGTMLRCRDFELDEDVRSAAYRYDAFNEGVEIGEKLSATPSPESPAAEEICNGVTPPHDECAGGECSRAESPHKHPLRPMSTTAAPMTAPENVPATDEEIAELEGFAAVGRMAASDRAILKRILARLKAEREAREKAERSWRESMHALLGILHATTGQHAAMEHNYTETATAVLNAFAALRQELAGSGEECNVCHWNGVIPPHPCAFCAVTTLRRERDEAREAGKRLNRRAQKAEGEVARLTAKLAANGGGSWGSVERQREARERDAGMEAVAKAEARSCRNGKES